MSRSWRRFGAFGRCSRKAIAAARFRQLMWPIPWRKSSDRCGN